MHRGLLCALRRYPAPANRRASLVALSKTVSETTITTNAGWSSVTAEEEAASDTWTVAGPIEKV